MNTALVSFLKQSSLRKTSISLILLIISTISVSFAQSIDTTITLTDEERIWLNKNPVIKASNNKNYAPIDFVSAGLPTGISIDYLNLVASKLGIQVEYVGDQTLNQNLELLRNREINLIHSISANEERQQHINFSRSYLNDVVVNYGRIDAPRINSLADLGNKKIGVIRGTILYDAYIKNHADLELVEVKDIPDALNALSTSRIDVFTAGEIVTDYLLQRTSISGIEIIGKDFILGDNVMFEHRFGTHKDDIILKSIIDKAMAKITQNEFNRILEKWIGRNYISTYIGLTFEEKAWLSQNPVIRVGVDPSFAPIEFINADGEIDGIVGEYLKRFSDRLGVKFVWAENPTWDDTFSMINEGKIDLLSNLTPTDERGEYLEFTDSFISISLVIFAKEGDQFFGNMDSLSGNTIAQVKGFSTLEFIKRDYPDVNIVEVDTILEALELVSGGKVDAYIGTIPTSSYYIAKEGITNIVISGETPYNAANAMGIRKELPLLASAMNKAVNSLTPMEKREISRDWLSLTIENRVDYTILWYTVSVFLIIGTVILIWNRKLVIARQEATHAREEAEAASAAKSHFLAAMSHDLRTPLNAIIGFSEVIQNELYGPLSNNKYKEYNRDIHSSGEYLLKLVNDILDVSKLEAGEKVINPVMLNFAELAEECKSLVHKLAEDKNITCNINISEEKSKIYADEQALMQIMVNIVSNAIKFTPNGGTVEINGQAIKDSYHIKVSDTGEGIAAEKIDRVKEPFVRAEESAHVAQKEGTGLGLAIVNALVKLHRGNLNIESMIGKGTVVTVSLPLNSTA